MFDVRSSDGSTIRVQFSLSATYVPAPADVTSLPAGGRRLATFSFAEPERPMSSAAAHSLRLYEPAPAIAPTPPPLPDQLSLFDKQGVPTPTAAALPPSGPPIAQPLPTLRATPAAAQPSR